MTHELEQRVLDVIQSGFPVAADPYAVLAEQLSCAAADVRQAVEALLACGTIRRIGASFSSGKLGYASTLCALAVDPERLDEVAAIVNEYPGVTHNYARENRYNMWFTLISPSDAARAATLDDIRTRTGCDDLLDLPATRLFKIRVDFGRQDAADGESQACHPERSAQREVEGSPAANGDSHEIFRLRPVASAQDDRRGQPFDAADPRDVAIVRWAQGNVVVGADGTLLERPFAVLEAQGIPEDELIDRLNELKADGTIRRFGAMVRHQRLGYAFNGMTVWDVPAELVEECGKLFASKSFVSHCYERPRMATWPYNLYAMVHAQTQDELDEYVHELGEGVRAVGVAVEPLVLVSTREFKKVSMRYFEEAQSTGE